MLFQQFCFSVVGEYGRVRAHLCIIRATTFYALPVPLPRQVSKILKRRVWKRAQKLCGKSGSKGSPNGPPKLTKIDKKRVQEGSQKETSKMDHLQDQEKWDFAIIYYTLARSEVSKKSPFWGPFWDNLGDKIDEIGFQIGGEKSSENILPNLVILGSILGIIFESKVGRLPVEE